MSKIAFQAQGDVAETLLIPLCLRARETQRPDALLRDEAAVALVAQIDYDFTHIKLPEHDQVSVILRVREFDRFTREFLARCPDATVVHIGCGLDTRFQRLDNGRVEWYDLDLPGVIDLRRRLLGERDRCHLVACSVFDPAWIDTVKASGPRPTLFVAEGVLQYFPEAQVKSLVLMLRERFPGAELVCDANAPFVVRMHNLELATTKFGARLHWGLKHARDVESWGEGIRLLEEWYYLDQTEPRLASMGWMRHIPFMAKSVGIFHYRLGEATL